MALSLYAFMDNQFLSLKIQYWFSLLLKITSLTCKYKLPKMTPHTSNRTTSTTTWSIKFWLMENFNLDFFYSLRYMFVLPILGGMVVSNHESLGQASQPIVQRENFIAKQGQTSNVFWFVSCGSWCKKLCHLLFLVNLTNECYLLINGSTIDFSFLF